MTGLETTLLIVIGLPVAGLSAIAIAGILRSWSLKTQELKLKEQQFHLEAKMQQESVNERMLTSHDSRMASTHLEKMEAEIKDLRTEISDLKTWLAAFTGTEFSEHQLAQDCPDPAPRKMTE